MNIQNYRENTVQNTVLSIIIALFIVVTGIIILFIRAEEAITLSFVGHLFRTEPLLVVLTILGIILPVGVFFLLRNYVKVISAKQTTLDEEHKKTLKTTDFISKLIQEDFDATYEADEDDKLGKSLMNLRDTLRNNKEVAEKRRSDDDIRNWTAEGLAKFGDLLRRDNDNLSNLAYNVVKNLTDYIGGIQGGFYLIQTNEKDEKLFELTAFYAYGRKKYADRQIKWGKGIIGTSAIELKSIYLTDLPDSYITVTSGLGQANPRCLLVSPMIANDELFGVFELASLQDLDEYKIKFVEQVAESTASILSTVQMNMQTGRLLEESKAQAQALSSQEEEMRQNMEELQATQEEAARQAERFMKLETTVNHTMIRAEYDIDGSLLYANSRFLDKLEYESTADVEGKPITRFISKKDTIWFEQVWQELSKGENTSKVT